MLNYLELLNFTAFQHLRVDFSPGLNVFVGPNSTGKTHVLKLLYAVTEAHWLGSDEPQKLGDEVAQKLLRVFLPSPKRLGRLVRRTTGGQSARVVLAREGKELSFRFSSNQSDDRFSEFKMDWTPSNREGSGSPIFIPPKDMLAHAPGFRSLYERREVHFDDTYRDILVSAFLPVSRGAPNATRRELKSKLEKLISGRIVIEGETFYLENADGKLEFTLLAEGLRKFALLLQLIENDTLRQSSLLFWDEPEANINPIAMKDLVDLLLHLSRELGVQIFLATHSDFILKELDLQRTSEQVKFFALYRENDKVLVETSSRADGLSHNAIDQENLRLYDEEIARVLGRTA